jgi:hypothetical protein
LRALEQPEQANRLFVDSVATAFVVHVAQKYGNASVSSRILRGALARWQERRAKDLLLAPLNGDVTWRIWRVSVVFLVVTSPRALRPARAWRLTVGCSCSGHPWLYPNSTLRRQYQNQHSLQAVVPHF